MKIKIKIFYLLTLCIIGCGTTQSLRDRLIAEHPEWTNEEIALIINNKIQVGMTKDMVIAAWGEPNYINENNSMYSGNTVAWSYISIFSSNIKAVTFQDDKVTMFNENKPN